MAARFRLITGNLRHNAHTHYNNIVNLQYSESFTSNMVDARMLEHLSKKELEKYLGVTRKFHQASIVHGIHLLRIMKYDRQVSQNCSCGYCVTLHVCFC